MHCNKSAFPSGVIFSKIFSQTISFAEVALGIGKPPNILPSLFSRFFMGRGAAGGDFAVVPFPAPEGETRDADGLPSPVPGFGCGFFACGAPLGFKPTGTGAFFFFFSRSFSDAAASAFGSFPFSAVSPLFPGDAEAFSSRDADFCFLLVAGATAASRLGGGGGIDAWDRPPDRRAPRSRG